MFPYLKSLEQECTSRRARLTPAVNVQVGKEGSEAQLVCVTQGGASRRTKARCCGIMTSSQRLLE